MGVHPQTLPTLAVPKVKRAASLLRHHHHHLSLDVIASEILPEVQSKRLSLLCPLTQVAQCYSQILHVLL